MFDTTRLAQLVCKNCGASEAIARVRGEFIDVLVRIDGIDRAISVKSTTGGEVDPFLEPEVLALIENAIKENT